MKKMIAALTALMMVLVLVPAAAEDIGPDTETAKVFASRWASGNIRIDISSSDGIWEVVVDLGYGATVWNYTCVHDSDLNALVSVDSETNTKSVITLDDNRSENGSEIVDAEAKAVFTVDGKGHLVWKDQKEDAGAGMAFEKIGWYEDDFYCDDYTLSCTWDVEESTDGEIYSGYKVLLVLENDKGITEWYYPCSYNAETDSLVSLFGHKEFKPANSEEFEIIYEDGSATFTMDREGNVLWNDEKENAGNGLSFQRGNG